MLMCQHISTFRNSRAPKDNFRNYQHGDATDYCFNYSWSSDKGRCAAWGRNAFGISDEDRFGSRDRIYTSVAHVFRNPLFTPVSLYASHSTCCWEHCKIQYATSWLRFSYSGCRNEVVSPYHSCVSAQKHINRLQPSQLPLGQSRRFVQAKCGDCWSWGKSKSSILSKSN